MKMLLSMTAMSLVTVLALTGCGGGSESSNTTPESTKPIVVEQPTLDENTSTVVEEPIVETPSVPRTYTFQENLDNKPTVSVAFPWSDQTWDTQECGNTTTDFWWDCDSEQNPYGLVWSGAGSDRNLDKTTHAFSQAEMDRINQDPDTLYLVFNQWNFYQDEHYDLPDTHKFYSSDTFEPHSTFLSEYESLTYMINFTHPDYPAHFAAKALSYKEAGADGIFFDWWNDNAGDGVTNDIPFEEVRVARMNIAKAIREAVGDEFIIMGNVNWGVSYSRDKLTYLPTEEYINGAFLELYQTDPNAPYVLTYADETDGANTPSWERLEDLLKYLDENLQEPRIIASVPFIHGETDADRHTDENRQYAKLHTAMAMVIPENGHILYGDKIRYHFEHKYYDFYHTDFGKATSSMIEVSEGVGYKTYETGVIAYNRTANDATITLDGVKYTIGALEGKFIQISGATTNQLPVANAGADQEITKGLGVILDGSSSSDSDGNIMHYLWKEGITTLSTQSSFTKSDFSVGTHTIVLTVTDNDGATSTDSIIITINENPLSKYEGNNPFAFLDGSEPLTPVWNSATKGWMHQASDTREQIVIDENFSVATGDEYVFENKIIWVRPSARKDIEIYGSLIIKNSLLLWDQNQHQQTRLRIKDGGNLRIENSYSFWANQYWVNWEFEDGSTVYFDNYIGDAWTSLHGSVNYTAINESTVKLTIFNETNNCAINIQNAHHVWLELFPRIGESSLSLPEKRQWTSWDLSDLWENTTVDIRSSYIYERDVSIDNGVHVTVYDTPSGFSMGWAVSKWTPGFIDCTLEGLGNPSNDDGVYYENMLWDLPCNDSSLTLINSKLQRTWPVSLGNVHLVIRNSNLVDIRNFGGAPDGFTTLEIYDSTIDHLATYQEGNIYVENSKIRYDIEAKDRNSVIYGYGISSRDSGRDIEIIETDGGKYIELDTSGVPW